MWKKCGLIFSKHHAQLPTILHIEQKLFIFYSTKDENNKSSIRKFAVNINNPKEILEDDSNVLNSGERGCFDDSGVMPACIIKDNEDIKLYFSGWNINKGNVPYGHGIGIAISNNGGKSFHRLSNGPILDRNKYCPYLVNSPFIVKESKDLWRMWFCNGIGWEDNFPKYNIFEGKSNNGIDWKIINKKLLGEENEAVSRPFIKDDSMWYSYKTKNSNYKIGFSKFYDNKWHRDDLLNNNLLSTSKEGWDSEMVCYPQIYNNYMFYNGNSYGKTGIGYAVWTD